MSIVAVFVEASKPNRRWAKERIFSAGLVFYTLRASSRMTWPSEISFPNVCTKASRTPHDKEPRLHNFLGEQVHEILWTVVVGVVPGHCCCDGSSHG